MLTNIHTCTQKYAYTSIDINTCINTHTCMHHRLCLHTYTYMHIHRCPHTHTHTNTRKQNPAYILSPSPIPRSQYYAHSPHSSYRLEEESIFVPLTFTCECRSLARVGGGARGPNEICNYMVFTWC